MIGKIPPPSKSHGDSDKDEHEDTDDEVAQEQRKKKPKILAEIQEMLPARVRAILAQPLDTPEQIAAYIAQRKKSYPTKSLAAAKEEEEREKKERGQLPALGAPRGRMAPQPLVDGGDAPEEMSVHASYEICWSVRVKLWPKFPFDCVLVDACSCVGCGMGGSMCWFFPPPSDYQYRGNHSKPPHLQTDDPHASTMCRAVAEMGRIADTNMAAVSQRYALSDGSSCE